jgi:hypothetical protein
MKKIHLLLAGVLVSSLAFASGPDDGPKTSSGMAVVRKSETSYKLIYKSELASDVKVKIFNEKNDLVFAETIKNSDGFIRPYNFAKLGEGEYTIKIDNGSNWLTEKVQYLSGKHDLVAHLTKLEEGKFLLSVPGYGEDKLNITVLNDQGETINRYDCKVSGDFAEVFDVSRVSGPVSFEITNKQGASTILKKYF